MPATQEGAYGNAEHGLAPGAGDTVWSTSVQFRNLTLLIVSKGLEERFGAGYRLDERDGGCRCTRSNLQGQGSERH